MGHDVIAIGNHKLNTASFQTTAVDLSEAFDVTVCYGYMDVGLTHKQARKAALNLLNWEGLKRMTPFIF